MEHEKDSLPAAPRATAEESSLWLPRAITVFISYRRNDGAWHADWIDRTLNGVAYTDASGETCRIATYYDRTTPGVADWSRHHFPSLQSAQALVLVCTPGASKDLTRPRQPDWLHEELRWWARHRKFPPIVIDTTGEGVRWLPDLVKETWPHLNWLDLDRNEAADAASSTDERYVTRWRERIIKTIRESEHATLFEDVLRLKRQTRRLTMSLGGIAALLLISASLWALAWHSGQRAERSNQASRRAIEFITDLFERADPDKTYGESLTAGQLLRAGTAAATDLHPEVKWRVLQAMGSAYTGLGEKQRSLQLLNDAAALAKPMSLQPQDRYPLELALGEALLYQENFSDAGEHLSAAKALVEEVHAEAHQDRSAVLVALGDLEAWSPDGNFDKARELYAAALEMDTTLNHLPDVARDHNRIGYLEFSDGNDELASKALIAAIDIARKVSGGASPLLIAQYEHDYAAVLYERGDFDAAYSRFSDAKQQFSAVYGPDSGEVASVENNLARICIERGWIDEARALLVHAVQVQETKFGGEFHDLAFSLNNLALIDMIDGKLIDARLKLRRAVRIAEAHKLHIGAQSLIHQAEISLADAKPAEAKEHLDRAAEILKRHQIDGWRLAVYDSALAELNVRRCDFDAAGKLFATTAPALKARWRTSDNVFTQADQRRRQSLQQALMNSKACMPS